MFVVALQLLLLAGPASAAAEGGASAVVEAATVVAAVGEAGGFRLVPALKTAAKSALRGGVPGAMAGAIQVLTLMWLRTGENEPCNLLPAACCLPFCLLMFVV